MQALLFISCGAILGASLRWTIGLLFNPLFSSFTFGTLIANLLGCLIIGVLLGLFWQFPQISAEWRLFLITGFLGSLTTFSSFSSEVVELFFNEKWLNGFCVLMMHLFGCLAMTVLGIWVYKICSQLLH